MKVFNLFLLILLGLLVSQAQSRFAMPVEAPVDRLIANCTAYIKENPKDAMGYYTLGRLHYLALWRGLDHVGSWDRNVDKVEAKLPGLAPDDMQSRIPTDKTKDKELTAKEAAEHLKQALYNLDIAIELDNKQAMFHLCLGSVLEQGAKLWKELPETQGLPSDEDKPGGLSFINPGKLFTDRVSQDPVIKAEARKKFKDLEKWIVLLAYDLITQTPRKANITDEDVRGATQAILDYWHRRAIACYAKAVELAQDADVKRPDMPLRGVRELVSYEAASAIIRLAKADGLEAEYPKLLEDAQKLVTALEKKPQRAITPIVFSRQHHKQLADLLDKNIKVEFNLDGTGRPQSWKWVKPDTAILVWNPQHNGMIDTGWQLFGSVSFFMFWDNGYRALDALDDNRDGWLSGVELDGLAAWFDRNGNGVCDPGEVIPLEQLGISKISTRALSKDGDSPMNSTGLIMRDGRVLPTYDWLAEPSE